MLPHNMSMVMVDGSIHGSHNITKDMLHVFFFFFFSPKENCEPSSGSSVVKSTFLTGTISPTPYPSWQRTTCRHTMSMTFDLHFLDSTLNVGQGVYIFGECPYSSWGHKLKYRGLVML